tara:strand:+ start:72 stop:248 length:177 start_codon:yes stop_codon:yes gene_type:complete
MPNSIDSFAASIAVAMYWKPRVPYVQTAAEKVEEQKEKEKQDKQKVCPAEGSTFSLYA